MIVFELMTGLGTCFGNLSTIDNRLNPWSGAYAVHIFFNLFVLLVCVVGPGRLSRSDESFHSAELGLVKERFELMY